MNGGRRGAGVQPELHVEGRESGTGVRATSRTVGITHWSSYARSLGFLAAGSTMTFQLIYFLL